MSTERLLSRKLAFVLLLWVCAFTLPWAVQASLCLVLIIARYAIPVLRPASLRAARAFSRFILYSVVVASLVIVLNAVLIKEGTVLTTTFGIPIHQEGMLFGARTASRLLLLSFSILLFFTSTPIPDFTRYLQHKGLPPSLVLVLLLTLHFLDQVPARIHQIFLAQQARGAPVDSGIVSRTKSLFSILSPLVLSSIVESVERGTALELRGFLQRPPSTQRRELDQSHKDWSTLLLIAVSGIILVYRMVQWLIG
ncbi:MAG: energy-coupling factor transporter transmembrane component T [Ignavibacteriales bacterium]|nr:energy-coupling factor transporter transmembrane component T [Ignavibacteriales bacterium]